MHPAFQGLIVVTIVVSAAIGYFYFSNLFLDRFIFPRRAFDAEDSRKRSRIALGIIVAAPIVGYFLLGVVVPWMETGVGFFNQGIADLSQMSAGASIGAFWSGVASFFTGVVLMAISVALAIVGYALFVLAFILIVAFIRILLTAILTHSDVTIWAFFGGIGVSLFSVVIMSFGANWQFFPLLVVLGLVVALWAMVRALRAQGQLVPPSTVGDNVNNATALRPWFFMFPALFGLGLYLAYPVFETLRLSLTERDFFTTPDGGSDFNYVWAGLKNYSQMVVEPKFREAVINNFLWLLVVPALSTAFGLLVAQLTDRLSWGNIVKSIIFMPMAISFVGASVIWKLVYDFRPEGTEQIGVLNAIIVTFGGDPQTWLTVPFWNNFLLMVVLIWIQTGFAMVILSAALRGIPEETIEAAIVDGANPFQIFFKIKIPQISGTILVVWTTITLTVLKVFDIVFAMTNGQWETQVLANYMYDKLFRASDWGVGSASAIVIMLLVTPILVWNVRNARKEMR